MKNTYWPRCIPYTSYRGLMWIKLINGSLGKPAFEAASNGNEVWNHVNNLVPFSLLFVSSRRMSVLDRIVNM